jgi:hypothetical protein
VAVEGINSKKLVYEKLYVSRGKEEPEESRETSKISFHILDKGFRFLSALSSPKTMRYLVLGKEHTSYGRIFYDKLARTSSWQRSFIHLERSACCGEPCCVICWRCHCLVSFGLRYGETIYSSWRIEQLKGKIFKLSSSK